MLTYAKGELPPIERTTFGDVFQIEVPSDCDVIIIGTLESQFKPRLMRLPHQCYVRTVRQMIESARKDGANVHGWAVFPAQSKTSVIVPVVEIPEDRGPVREPRCICASGPAERCPGNRCKGPKCGGHGRWHAKDADHHCLFCADRVL